MSSIYSFEKELLLIKNDGKKRSTRWKNHQLQKKSVDEIFRKIDKNLRVRVGVFSKCNSI